MDKLSPLLSHFNIQAGVFFAGNMCGGHAFERDELHGHLHVIRRGRVQLMGKSIRSVDVTEPTLVFMPQPNAHRLLSDNDLGADVVCGTVLFGGGGRNPITDSLPTEVIVKLAEIPHLESLIDLIFDEAFAQSDGKQAVMNRLCEVLIIQLLRHCVDTGQTDGGTLSGLGDPKLALAILAMQASPEKRWSLEEMAQLAGMSRARFAFRFKQVVRETPGEFLASWRVMTAQKLLQKGKQVKHVVDAVGYSSSSALNRAFVRKLGMTPTEWLRESKT